MADDDGKKDRLRDRLHVMSLIGAGRNQVDELMDALDWTRDRVEETVDDLSDHDYVKRVQDGSDQILEITDRGRDEVPKLMQDVADDTREFFESVADTFQKHFDRVFPKVRVNVDVDVEEPDDE